MFILYNYQGDDGDGFVVRNAEIWWQINANWLCVLALQNISGEISNRLRITPLKVLSGCKCNNSGGTAV